MTHFSFTCIACGRLWMSAEGPHDCSDLCETRDGRTFHKDICPECSADAPRTFDPQSKEGR